MSACCDTGLTAFSKSEIILTVKKMLKKLLFIAALFAASPAQANEQQIQCLAQNAYFEAGNQGTSGMQAVTNVVMNRVKDKRFPNTPCKVIKQRTRKSCQFSWVCANLKVKDRSLYDRSVAIVRQVYYNKIPDNTNGALYFHERRYRPYWSYKMKLTIRVGDHKFYRG